MGSETWHGIKRFEEFQSYLDGALSASQLYRAQTLRQKHDPLWGYRRLPYSRQKDGVCVDLFFVGLFQDLA